MSISAEHEHKELKARWKNEVEVATYSQKDVLKHNSKKDLWIIIHGKVYDVTEYARDHPGGVDALLEVAGVDATSAYEDVGHSEDAREIMNTCLKGVLEGAAEQESKAVKTDPLPPTQIVKRHSNTNATEAHLSWAKLSTFAAGTTGLMYLAHAFYGTPSSSRTSQTLDPRSHNRSFTDGFLVASTVLSIAGVVGAGYFSKAISFSKPFSSYPEHVHSTNPQHTTFRPAGILIPTVYQKLKLRRKDELSDGIYRFVFDLPTKYSVLGLPIGQHVAIKATVDDHTVVRSYTPISNNRDLGRLELLIRVYPQGQVGNYLKNLKIGDAAEIRGPKGAMKYRRGMSKKIGMIAGGTGITPLFQLIRAICEDPKDDTEISLVYGNRSESDIMLKDKLDHFAQTAPKNFKVFYTLDQPGPGWKGNKGHVTKQVLREKMPSPVGQENDVKALLCGPPGMVNAMKGYLVELGFVKPGAVSKMSDQIFCF